MQENHDESPANDIVDNTPKVQELGGLTGLGGWRAPVAILTLKFSETLFTI